MLVTNIGWADPDPVMRDLAEDYRAWRYVAWTGETLIFWVIGSRAVRDDSNKPDGWLVGGPEALLEAAGELQIGTFAVYVLDYSDDDRAAGLRRVTAIWRERGQKDGEAGFWYATDRGELKPCSRLQFPTESQFELVSELVFDRRVGYVSHPEGEA